MLPLATQQEKQFIFRGKVQKLHYFSLKVMDFFNKLFLIYGKWLAQQDWAIWYFSISLQDFFWDQNFTAIISSRASNYHYEQLINIDDILLKNFLRFSIKEMEDFEKKCLFIQIRKILNIVFPSIFYEFLIGMAKFSKNSNWEILIFFDSVFSRNYMRLWKQLQFLKLFWYQNEYIFYLLYPV